MATLDTNVLLRWLLNDVPEQAAAAERLMTSGTRLVVPDVALIEVVYVLERVLQLSRETVASSVGAVLAVADVHLDRAVWRDTMDAYLAHPKLSVADTYLSAQATASGNSPLYTFDQKLARQRPGAELLNYS